MANLGYRIFISLRISGGSSPLVTSGNNIFHNPMGEIISYIESRSMGNPNPYRTYNDSSMNLVIPIEFNTTFDFYGLNNLNGYETSGSLYSAYESLGSNIATGYSDVLAYSHTDLTDEHVGFVCKTLYDWSVEAPSGVWNVCDKISLMISG